MSANRPPGRADPVRSNVLTASRLTTARTCQRKHYLEYEVGIRPAGRSRALSFGTAFHDGLASWWWNFRLDESQRVSAMLHTFAATAAEEQLEWWDVILGEELLIGYHTRWVGEPWETIGVEVEFDIPLRNPATGRPSQTFVLHGKCDVIARHTESGRIKVPEHKTASSDISVGSEYWERLLLDGQVSLYVDGARSLKEAAPDVDTVTYDVIGKPKMLPLTATPEADRKYTQKPSKLADGTVRPAGSLYAGQREADETPDEYRARIAMVVATRHDELYRRGDVTRSEEDLDEFRFDIWQTAQQIRESYAADRHPRNFDACWRYGTLCPYFPICTKKTTTDDPDLYVKLENVHPELTDTQTSAEGG